MIFDAMKANNAEGAFLHFLRRERSCNTNHSVGVALCEVHPDLEVFRLRLGKALNFEYHEDSQMGLFQRRDPREG